VGPIEKEEMPDNISSLEVCGNNFFCLVFGVIRSKKFERQDIRDFQFGAAEPG
jgi:hypothetical protein